MVLFLLSALIYPLSYLKLFFEVIFGLTICVVDGPSDQFPFGPRLKRMLVENVPMLYTNKGKTLFYLFIASLEGTQNWDSFLHVLIGFYFLGIAVIHIALSLNPGPQHAYEAREPQFQQSA